MTSRHGKKSAASRADNHIYFFVPEKDVDIVCLASYLKRFHDATATIRPSKHPQVSHLLRDSQ
jgi:hypothetical protein